MDLKTQRKKGSKIQEESEQKKGPKKSSLWSFLHKLTYLKLTKALEFESCVEFGTHPRDNFQTLFYLKKKNKKLYAWKREEKKRENIQNSERINKQNPGFGFW